MDVDLFYAVRETQKSSWGAYNTVVVWCKSTKRPLKTYYDGYSENHPYFWKTLLAADIENGTL